MATEEMKSHSNDNEEARQRLDSSNSAPPETSTHSSKDNEDDPYIVNMQTRATVQHDLLCLGNQLPYFVLQKLFELTVDKFQKQSHKRSLSEYVLLYLGQKMSPKPDKNTKTNSSTSRATNCCVPSVEECVLSICNTTEEGDPRATKKRQAEHKHILHVVHDNYLSFEELKERGSGLPIMLCASELDFAGVKFVAQTGEDLSKVEFGKKPRPCGWFRRAEFEIPKLTVDDATEPFLRNLIAFEQCCPDVPNNVTSFAFLMGLLVNTEKDVQVLTKAEIIHNLLGTDQDAADLFNNLCKEVVPGEFPFAQTCREAVEYSKLCWPTNIAHVRRTYFASPWTFIAFCVGFIAFGIGVTQFILSFL
ncbi:hypothetical protein RHMOL_Rhmol05G0291700 [Rhododendron molle]|uniref:Uncharacterized protein n=1 Tax=Rhododendron molle TaxID=49168 RepID=A0ACC0NVJ4_RHOML|nr:hypothetical protein RHMOL_Rhmol05G0291700 [Rhododendron molle]